MLDAAMTITPCRVFVFAAAVWLWGELRAWAIMRDALPWAQES